LVGSLGSSFLEKIQNNETTDFTKSVSRITFYDNQKYLSPKKETDIGVQSCKDISFNEHLQLGDKLIQIKSTFQKFKRQNEKIQKSINSLSSLKELRATPLSAQYKLPNFAIGFGILKGILNIKIKEQIRY
jgi:hypothetical protein